MKNITLILLLFFSCSMRDRVFNEEYSGTIIEIYDAPTKRPQTYIKIRAGNQVDSILVTFYSDEFHSKVKVGDSIIKIKESFEMVVHRLDTVFRLNLNHNHLQ